MKTESYRILFISFYATVTFSVAAFFATIIPPFQAPDEFEHYFYARSIANGQVMPINDGHGFVGGSIRSDDHTFAAGFAALPFHPQIKADSGMYTDTASTGSEAPVIVTYAGAAVYPPYVYAVPALAMVIGDVLALEPRQTFVFARLANASIYVALTTLALWLFPSAIAAMALALPMALSQAGSISPDATCVPIFAIITALVLKSQGGYRLSYLVTSSLLLALLAAVKLPALAMLIPLWVAFVRSSKRTTIGLSLIVVAAPMCWNMFFVDIAPLTTRQSTAVSAISQIQYLASSPWVVIPIAVETIKQFGGVYVSGLIGNFGWLDTPLSQWFYWLAAACLAFSAITSSIQKGYGDISHALRAALIIASLVVTGMTFGAMYIAATEVGHPIVTGVQGRYFIPMVAVLAMAITGWVPAAPHRTIITLAPFAILLWASAAHIPFSLIERFYLQAG